MGHVRLDIICPGGAAEREYCQFAQEASKTFPCFLREFEIEPLVRRYFRTEDGLTASETPLSPRLLCRVSASSTPWKEPWESRYSRRTK